MKYKRKYQTDEERRRAKSEAGRRGAEALKRSGNFRGGRPKGSRNKNAPFRFPTRTLTVRQPDYEVIVKMAHAMAVPIVEFLHAAAESWRERNPSLFANDIVLKI